jgi:hypothetical protein
MPGAVSPGSPGPRVQLLNPTGRADVALAVTERLVAAGANLVIAGDTDAVVAPATRVVYYSSAARAGAELVRDAVQAGEVVQEQDAVEGLDVTVVIGADVEPAAPATGPTTSAGDDPTG